jgi:UDP-2-acetamido-3-amino-2,3-dideoxy-glucuronate N-acetyltransferase
MDLCVPRIAVVGSGRWGINLVRQFHDLGALQLVCDTREEVLQNVSARYGSRTTLELEEVLKNEQVDGVAIAAPAELHFQIARHCLLRGKDVYVEKPLALNLQEGRELLRLAAEQNRLLMVGHILEYHPAVIELRRLIRSGELGRIQYVYSSRLNLGTLRTEENILWSFAPHDISAILFLLGEMPTHVSAHGGSYLDARTFDTTLTTCEFASGVQAHIFVSWLHPFKEQKLAIVASKKMAVFDDVQPERKLVLYPHRIDWLDRVPVAHKAEGEMIGLPSVEPLRQECEHFLQCIRTRSTPRTSGTSALRVLEVLEACEQSLRSSGSPVEVTRSAPSYFAHPTAVVDQGAQIGEGSKIWHFSHIMPGSQLGVNCNLGQNVVISPGVKIGNNVKIQNNVSVYTGVVLEDDVFCGPSMVFTNVVNPRSAVLRKHEYQSTLVRRGASIGANATVVCGVTLGRYCFVAAGAVVTHDVPNYALVIGVPAVRVGWMCQCGVRLEPSAGEAQCRVCSRQYQISDCRCEEAGVIRGVPASQVSAADRIAA